MTKSRNSPANPAATQRSAARRWQRRGVIGGAAALAGLGAWPLWRAGRPPRGGIDPSAPDATGVRSFEADFTSLDLQDGAGGGTWATSYWWADGSGASLDTNGELQWSIDHRAPATRAIRPWKVRDGELHIEAARSPPALADALRGKPYTSGLLTTHGRFAQQEGYFEMLARPPRGRGLWPAFWLLPASGDWPPEIDVMEVLGHAPQTVYGTVHWTGPGGAHLSDQGTARLAPSEDGFHRYGLLWQGGRLTWYADGAPYFTRPAPPGLDRPMYLLLGLAVGGTWPGNPDAQTRFPARFTVRRVTVWRRRDAETGDS